ncbi:TonB-dependent receptor [Arenibacter sp. 6A1]|nr:TonB-dependent receptor [Arenibacter sp. 6A1]
MKNLFYCITRYRLFKLDLKMKLTALLLIINFFGIQANPSYSQKTVTLDLEGVKISRLLGILEHQTDYLFAYKINDVNLDREVHIKANKEKIHAVLEKVFRNTETTFRIFGNQIFLSRKQNPSLTFDDVPLIIQQSFTVTGTVTEADTGLPIPGANILEKGTYNGVMTDFDGNYSIEVSNNAFLEISFIGFTSQQVKVDNRNKIDIVMETETAALDEVVVVGYGVQKKQTMTAAASVMKMDDIKSSSSTNITSTLGGRVSGVLIQQQGGEAGYENPKIMIRGSSSPNSSDPLIVVDGIVGRSMGQLTSDEIESMTILKDASAVAPYGARGANGVILIKTKRGKAGNNQVNYNFKGGFGEPTRLPKIASSYDHARYMNDAWRNKEMDLGNEPGQYGIYSQEELQKFKDGSDPYGYPNTNWQKEVLLPRAWQEQHGLNASGGNEKVQYFLGLGYSNQDALYGDVRTNTPSTGFKRYNVRANIDANLVDNLLKLSGNIALRQEDRNTIPSSTNFIFHNMYRNPQTDPGRFPDGKLGKVSLGHNPIGLITEGGYVNNKKTSINTNFIVDLSIPNVEGLNVKGVFAFDKGFSYQKKWETPINYYIWNKTLEQYDGSSPNREGSDLTESFGNSQSYSAELQVNYNKRIADDHQIGALFLYSVSEDKSNNFWAARYKYLFSTIPQLFAGPEKDKDNSGSATESGKIGTVFRLTYNYKEKYMVETNGRIDGSEKFPKNRRYGFFPSVSVAWRVSSEPFMQSINHVLNNLKLRSSWGLAGADNIGRFSYMSAYGVGNNAVFGGQSPNIAMGYTETRFADPNITWETSEMFNVGIDAALFRNKLTFEADYFYKVTRDILLARTDIPNILGYKVPAANVGVVDNRGIDLNITHRNNIADFNYSIAGNLTWARNKIIDLLEPEGQKNNPRQRRTGHPMGQYFGYEALGLYKTNEEADNAPQMQFGQAKAGDIRYKDQNGDGIINAEDRVAIGRTDYPELIFGLNLQGEYKGFDLGLFFQGAGMTNLIYDGFLTHPYLEGRGGTLFDHHIGNSWTPENLSAEFPRLYYGGSPINREISTFWLRDASYLRLKNIELGYDFKTTAFAQSNLIKGFRIYAAGQNLATWSAVKYLDPEVRSNTIYPQMKTFTLGVNVTF